jgi:hypothetical protein
MQSKIHFRISKAVARPDPIFALPGTLPDLSAAGPGTLGEDAVDAGVSTRTKLTRAIFEDAKAEEPLKTHADTTANTIVEHVHVHVKPPRTTGPVKGGWITSEDNQLRERIQTLKSENKKLTWKLVADAVPSRSAKQCRERWSNHIAPDIKHGKWTQEEDRHIARQYLQVGSAWSAIASKMPGRTDNAVKNRFNSSIRPVLASLDDFLDEEIDDSTPLNDVGEDTATPPRKKKKRAPQSAGVTLPPSPVSFRFDAYYSNSQSASPCLPPIAATLDKNAQIPELDLMGILPGLGEEDTAVPPVVWQKPCAMQGKGKKTRPVARKLEKHMKQAVSRSTSVCTDTRRSGVYLAHTTRPSGVNAPRVYKYTLSLPGVSYDFSKINNRMSTYKA